MRQFHDLLRQQRHSQPTGDKLEGRRFNVRLLQNLPGGPGVPTKVEQPFPCAGMGLGGHADKEQRGEIGQLDFRFLDERMGARQRD